MALVLAFAAPPFLVAQNPPTAAQNPSPMVERTRAHERIADAKPAGERQTFDGPLGKPVTLFVPTSARNAKTVRLVVHFHGSAFLPEHAIARAGKNYVVAGVQLGSGSGIYDVTFSERVVFDSLLANIARALAAGRAAGPQIGSLVLTGFSAGHGAIRAILRDSAHFSAINAVLLLDGMHTSYEPAGQVVALGGRLETSKLSEFLRYAHAAITGSKRFLVTHSEIFPGTFASTTETADFLLDKLALERKPVLAWGPLGMQQTSEVRKGRFALLGFAGNSAPDHVDHFHGMYHFFAALERL
ncbi:MAG: hypothetical protein ACT4O1_14705 [Gemmatimonadota bacterium]